MTKETVKFYYQIDYIDKDGLANYIDTFDENEYDRAIQHTNILNRANACLNKDTKFVLDKYSCKIADNPLDDDYDSDKLIAENLTNAETIKERHERVKKEMAEERVKNE